MAQEGTSAESTALCEYCSWIRIPECTFELPLNKLDLSKWEGEIFANRVIYERHLNEMRGRNCSLCDFLIHAFDICSEDPKTDGQLQLIVRGRWTTTDVYGETIPTRVLLAMSSEPESLVCDFDIVPALEGSNCKFIQDNPYSNRDYMQRLESPYRPRPRWIHPDPLSNATLGRSKTGKQLAALTQDAKPKSHDDCPAE